MQPSAKSKPGTEVARSTTQVGLVKIRDRKASNVPEKVSEHSAQEALGTVA
jgi:hypothetical protein